MAETQKKILKHETHLGKEKTFGGVSSLLFAFQNAWVKMLKMARWGDAGERATPRGSRSAATRPCRIKVIG